MLRWRAARANLMSEARRGELTRLRCLECGGTVVISRTHCACSKCAMKWPVVNDIPRFSAVDGYWGEMSRQEARELLEDARSGSWIKAVHDHFPAGDMNISILDLQRAAWLPLLGLGRDAVALDVGSGLGAITHSLARSLGEVYSVEAVPERIEFTQVRLQQEGLNNVRLIQASALNLPFLEESFDLIVVNGVLEWVGEWNWKGDPADVQLKFLMGLNKLLRKDGVVVVGIENRFGYNNFLGAMDHSGMPYTSLMPRRLATFWLRKHSTPHHRTTLNSGREYRTYTYSARGYRKLLMKAGFSSMSFYWADPGYNQPYKLIPISERRLIQRHLWDLLDHPGPRKSTHLKMAVKRFAAKLPMIPWVIPDYVIFARKAGADETKLELWLQKQLNAGAGVGRSESGPQTGVVFDLQTRPFASNQVLRLWKPAQSCEIAFAKVDVRVDEPTNYSSSEYSNLDTINKMLSAAPERSVCVPKLIGSLTQGNTYYFLETAARGVQFSRRIRRPRYFSNFRRVKKDFARVIRASVDLSQRLAALSNVRKVDSTWYKIPREPEWPQGLATDIARMRYFTSGDKGGWVQHGDFTVENIILDPAGDRIEVIDWGDMAGGFPPLYDVFSLILSSGYVRRSRNRYDLSNNYEYRKASFSDLFFSGEGLGPIMAELVTDACGALNVPAQLIPALLLEFLIIRINYYRTRGGSGSGFEQDHPTLLKVFAEESHRPIFGLYPLASAGGVGSTPRVRTFL